MATAGGGAVLVRRRADVALVHHTGERDVARVREEYQRAGIPARAESFLDPVAREVAEADLVICRAGATTLAELAAAGRPALLVPFPAATDDHQRRNAQVLERAGAAVILEESALSADRLAGVTADLMADEPRLARMAQAMRQFARPDAAARIVDRLLALAGPERQAA
jgi:UDP-N-acetylglucosamine--N-acetylmuramyl-(pentapeptide) pyrophosphoryl-undecaprenol N-acetylglucosamine transferase